MRQRQILDVKEVYALAEDLRLMILLDPEALSRMPPPEPLLKDCQNIWVHHVLRESFWAGRGGRLVSQTIHSAKLHAFLDCRIGSSTRWSVTP